MRIAYVTQKPLGLAVRIVATNGAGVHDIADRFFYYNGQRHIVQMIDWCNDNDVEMMSGPPTMVERFSKARDCALILRALTGER